MKKFFSVSYEDGAELCGRLYFRVNAAFHLITVARKCRFLFFGKSDWGVKDIGGQ